MELYEEVSSLIREKPIIIIRENAPSSFDVYVATHYQDNNSVLICELVSNMKHAIRSSSLLEAMSYAQKCLYHLENQEEKIIILIGVNSI